MLIRSQDGKDLINMGLCHLSVDENFVYSCDPMAHAIPVAMGSYGSEERATEVLDKIQNAYQHNVAVYKMPEK